jgi:hypothetical protein
VLLVLFHWSFHSRSIFVLVSGDGSFAWSRFSLRDCTDVKFSFFLLLVHAGLSFCTSVLSAGGGKFLVFLSCSQAKGAGQNSISRFRFFRSRVWCCRSASPGSCFSSRVWANLPCRLIFSAEIFPPVSKHAGQCSFPAYAPNRFRFLLRSGASLSVV